MTLVLIKIIIIIIILIAQHINIHFLVRNKFLYKIISGDQNMQLLQVMIKIKIKNKIQQ